jgi:hypothetical protein
MNRVAVAGIGALIAVAVGGGSFFGGMMYGESQARSSFTGQAGAAGRFGAGQAGQGGTQGSGQTGTQGGARAGGLVFGTIQSLGANDLTVTEQNGNVVQVHVTGTTLIQKQASVGLADLTQGDSVVVSGSQGSDGSITAGSLQVTTGGGFSGQPGGGFQPRGGQGAGTGGGAPTK